MMKYTTLLLAAASGVFASLNCTLTGELKTYCCPNTNSDVVKTIPVGGLVMLGCAADNTNKQWFWNYNGLYTPTTKLVRNCNLNGIPFNDLAVLPDCKDDTYVLELTKGKTSPLDQCNAQCIQQNDLPDNTYFGDKQKESNMATDFPQPPPSGGWPWPPGGGWKKMTRRFLA